MSNSKGWIGVDLDGTLAHYETYQGPTHIGDAIPKMLERVLDWINEGKIVKIFTARALNPISVPYIELWLENHGIGGLEITAIKDSHMIELWDDRCIQVIKNQGIPILEQALEAQADAQMDMEQWRAFHGPNRTR
jgi:hypothetical protein